jgi:hypothetical protein
MKSHPRGGPLRTEAPNRSAAPFEEKGRGRIFLKSNILPMKRKKFLRAMHPNVKFELLLQNIFGSTFDLSI